MNTDLIHESKITRVQWLILLVCMMASMIEGFDIVVISYTAPAITQEWAISSGELGVVFSAGVFGMTLGAMALGGLSDLYGRRVVVSASLFVAGLGTLAVANSSTVAELVVLRVIAGVALGALVATLPVLVGEFSPRRHRTLIISVLIASANFGGFGGGLIAAELIADHGWQNIFLYTGILTIINAVLVWLLIPESIAFIARRQAEGALETVNRTLAYIGQNPVSQLAPIAEQEERESASVKALLISKRRPTTLLLWSAFFLAFLVVYFISSWMPQVLAGSGLTQQQAIRGTTALPLGAILGNILIGWLSTWWQLKRLIVIAVSIGGLCMVVLSGMHSLLATMPFLLIWGMLFITGASMFGAFGSLFNITMTVYPVQVRGTGLGWSVGLGRAGAVISPTLAGVMMTAGLSIPSLFCVFAVPAFITGLCVAFITIQELS